MASTPVSKSSSGNTRHSQKRTRSSRVFVPNSSEDEDDTIKDEEPKPASQRVLRSVTIPVTDTRKAAITQASSAKSTALSTKRANSYKSLSFEGSDYETPGTSMSATPAMSAYHNKSLPCSGLNQSVNSILDTSASQKRLGYTIPSDSDLEDKKVDLDAEIALQMQLEDEQQMQFEDAGDMQIEDAEETQSEDEEVLKDMMPRRKRQKTKTQVNGISSADELSEFSLPSSFKGNRQFKKTRRSDFAGKGKGKGKAKAKVTSKGKANAKAEEIESDANTPWELQSVPPDSGKGKSKAKTRLSLKNSSRSSRLGAQRNSKLPDEPPFLNGDESGGGESDGEDFKPSDTDDLDSMVDNLDSPMMFEREDGSLVEVPAFLKIAVQLSGQLPENFDTIMSAPAKSKRLEARRRQRDFAHITDKWERKRAMNRARAEAQHPKLRTMWDELKNIPVLETQKAEQPVSINRRLKPFQLEGLSWMMRQEKTHYKGGLLGDEMGMGKTIQAVSLIMSDYPAKHPTLVCVPPVALMQWSNEIREYTNNKLKVLVYHGTNAKCKKMSIKELKSYDVIMVSYNSLESLHRKETKGWSRGEDIIKEASSLHAIHYHRLILDEAHSIKSRNTGVAKACFALTSNYKWCLSGTPVQNRIGEFFSLLRFLEVRPFADYFCRSCNCEKIHWAVDDDHMCVTCNHGASEHISVFNQELLNPITGDDPVLREEALAKLHLITARIMLRRMKRDHTNSMELPMKDIIIHNEFFSEIERDFSTSIMSNTSRKFDTYVAQGVMLNNYANIFGLIMQMRQVANHPDLLLKKNAVEGSGRVYVCNVCDEPAEDAVRSQCRHEFCRACIKDFMDTCEASGTEADCPRCHIALAIDFEQPELQQDEDSVKKTSIVNRINMENWTSSTKIEMLVYDLYKLRSKKQTLKSIVFSQFTSMLQLIEWRLRRAGFSTVMLDGSMSPAQRQKSIDHFMKNPDVEVFLVSLKAGGVALNLTEASRVFIVDPWWNPAAEWQSADRCHRIGQKRPCVITRLCIEDSVESRMVALQEKKAAMIAGTVNNDKVAMDRLSPEDLQFLFRGT